MDRGGPLPWCYGRRRRRYLATGPRILAVKGGVAWNDRRCVAFRVAALSRRRSGGCRTEADPTLLALEVASIPVCLPLAALGAR